MAEPRRGSDKPVPSKDEGGRAMRIDTALVRELAELLTETNLTAIEVEDGDRKVKVCRDPAPVIAAAPASAQAPIGSASSSPSAGSATVLPEPVDAEIAGETIKAPMVGTAFLSPEPSAKPFVSVGDAVKAGDTLLIVEAMKVMNPITAPKGGVIRKILVSDGQPVEFDQPLMVLG